MALLLPFEQLYTVIPESKLLFEKEMFDGLPKLPEHAKMTAYGIEKVDFPVYLADPSALLPSGFMAVTLDEAMDEMKDHVYNWIEHGEPRANGMLPASFHDLPMEERASTVANFMNTYKNEKAAVKYLNHVITNTLSFPDNDMSERLFRTAFLVELGAKAGEELKDLYFDVVTYGTDLSNTEPYIIPAELEWAGESKSKMKTAIKNILEHQHNGLKMPHEQVAEMGQGLVEFGLSQPTLKGVASTAFSMGMVSNPEVKVEPKLRQESMAHYNKLR